MGKCSYLGLAAIIILGAGVVAPAPATAQSLIDQCVDARSGRILNSALCNCLNISHDSRTNRFVARGDEKICAAILPGPDTTAAIGGATITGSGGTGAGGGTGTGGGGTGGSGSGGSAAGATGNPGNEPGISGPGTEVGNAGENPGGGGHGSPTEAQGKGG